MNVGEKAPKTEIYSCFKLCSNEYFFNFKIIQKGFYLISVASENLFKNLKYPSSNIRHRSFKLSALPWVNTQRDRNKYFWYGQ